MTRLIPTRVSVPTAVVLSYTPPSSLLPFLRPGTFRPSGRNGKDGTVRLRGLHRRFLHSNFETENNAICHVFFLFGNNTLSRATLFILPYYLNLYHGLPFCISEHANSISRSEYVQELKIGPSI